MRASSHAVYPWKSADGLDHFFVEFAEESSVKRARALQLLNTKVQVLAYSPQLIADFNSVAPSDPIPTYIKEEHDAQSMPLEETTMNALQIPVSKGKRNQKQRSQGSS